MDWKDKLKEIDKEAGSKIIDELDELLETLKSGGNVFLQQQTVKISGYLVQLSTGAITFDQLNFYLEDIKDLLIAEGLKASVETKVTIDQVIKAIATFLSGVVSRLIIAE
jgi:hypothetical protein